MPILPPNLCHSVLQPFPALAAFAAPVGKEAGQLMGLAGGDQSGRAAAQAIADRFDAPDRVLPNYPSRFRRIWCASGA